MDTHLRQQILTYLQTIPQGKVATYKAIAEHFNIHPRAVASVMKYNQDPITYPCYKVIANSGRLSGYNTSRGVAEKIEKLQKDGIEIVNGKVEQRFMI